MPCGYLCVDEKLRGFKLPWAPWHCVRKKKVKRQSFSKNKNASRLFFHFGALAFCGFRDTWWNPIAIGLSIHQAWSGTKNDWRNGIHLPVNALMLSFVICSLLPFEN